MQYFQIGENDTLKRRIYLHLVDATDGITPETGEAGNTAQVSINGKAPTTSRSTLVAVDATNQPGTYYLELSPSELQFPGVIIVRYKSANTAEFVALGQVMAFDPYTQFGQFGGGGGADVDYQRIKKLVDEAVGSLPQPEKPQPVDLFPLQSAITELYTEIRAIKIPEAAKLDITPVLEQLKSIKKSISGITIPETDLSPVTSKLSDLEASMIAIEDMQGELKEAQMSRIREFFEADISKIESAVSELKEQFEAIPFLTLNTKPKSTTKGSVLDEYLKS